MSRTTLFRITLSLLFLTLLVGALPGLRAGIAQAKPPAAEIPEIVIEAHDFSFTMPDEIQAGLVAITMKNSGHEPHQAVIGRLPDDATMEDLMAAFSRSESEGLAMLEFVGGPNAVGPGESQQAIVELREGTYVALCFVPSADGVAHLVKGMVRSFEVGAGSGQESPAAPVADVEVTVKDFEVAMPAEVSAGRQVWKVSNAGPEQHEVSFLKLAEGKTIDDVAAFMQNAAGGPPPFEFAGGMSPLQSGKDAWMTLDLEPGNYLALCFIPSAAHGEKRHLELGMVTPFTVVAAPEALPTTGSQPAWWLGALLTVAGGAGLLATAWWVRRLGARA